MTPIGAERSPVATRAVVLLAGIATVAMLYAAHWFFVPAALGVTLATVLYPAVGALRRLRLPAPAAAAIAVFAAVAILFGIGASLGPPISGFAQQVPKSIATARAKIAGLGGPFRRLAPPPVVDPSAAAPTQPRTQPPPSTVQPRQSELPTPVAGLPTPTPAEPSQSSQSPGLSSVTTYIERAFGVASSLLTETVEVVLLALFILGTGDGWREKLALAVRDPERRRRVAETVGEMRAVVSRYFIVTLLINLFQAIAIGVGLKLLGYSSPTLWGALTFLLEFIPFIGGLVMVALLLVVGLGGDRSALGALSGPILYLAVTTLQNNLVSPIAYGRGLRLSPTAILAGLIFFWGLWGVAGAFLAVPILAAIQVLSRRISTLNGVAAFLSE